MAADKKYQSAANSVVVEYNTHVANNDSAISAQRARHIANKVHPLGRHRRRVRSGF